MLWSELERTGGTTLLILDEIDNVEDDSILYQLPRARANNNLSQGKVGVIGISNDFSFRDNLSPKVKSSLCETELHFPAYDAKQLQAILRQREEKAFRDAVIEPDVIPYCAAYGAKDAGDARQAIDLLMSAGDRARDQGAEAVTVDHVEEARKELKRGRIEEGIRGLTKHGRLVLYALLTNDLEGETPMRSRSIRPRYTRFCERAETDPLVFRRMRDHLDELTMLGIVSVTERNEGRRGGSYREYELDIEPKTILAAMSDIHEMVGVHESVVETALQSGSIDEAEAETVQ